MSYKIVIPARLNSSRFPEKMLKPIAGNILLWHTWQQAMKSSADEIVIATDSDVIYERCTGFGAKVVMTSSKHLTGTDRIYEVCSMFGWNDDDIIINVQGDEPLVPVEYIETLARMLDEDGSFDVATLAHVIKSNAEILDPNIVKAVFKKNGEALYFSRATIPYNADTYYGHIGLYSYRVRGIRGFVSSESSNLEVAEKLEQLRFLENGFSIKVGLVADKSPIGVNTESDYIKVRKIIEDSIL